MISRICAVLILCLLYFIIAEDASTMVYSFRPPCFDVLKVDCNTTLEDSFTSDYPVSGTNKPETQVYLFTPENPDAAEPLHLCGGALPPSSNYDVNIDTEIIIHGRADGICRTSWMREMKNELFARGKYNVILVDWTWGNSIIRSIAIANTKVVGQQVGYVINNIMKQTGTGSDKFHVIGHSLGTIVSGFTGRNVKGLLRRITALDPSYGPFSEGPPDQRITFRDAQIVDAIHTNAYHSNVIGIGDERPLGHADFYPNGGLIQLSCYPYILQSLLKRDYLYALISLEPRFCSHLQAIQFYKASINAKGCGFVGVRCSSYGDFTQDKCVDSDWAVMGMDYELYHSDDDTPQKKYYLKTSYLYPYYYDNRNVEDNHNSKNRTCTEKSVHR